jgi:hypothetical protein
MSAVRRRRQSLPWTVTADLCRLFIRRLRQKILSADYADYTDFKTKRVRELEAQSGNKFKEHSLSADLRRLLFKNNAIPLLWR